MQIAYYFLLHDNINDSNIMLTTKHQILENMLMRARSQFLHMFENSYFNIQDIYVGYFVTSISVASF